MSRTGLMIMDEWLKNRGCQGYEIMVNNGVMNNGIRDQLLLILGAIICPHSVCISMNTTIVESEITCY